MAAMHAFQHIVSGDTALEAVKSAFNLDDDDLVNMDDDLSLGPLQDLDAGHAQRASFWRRVFGSQAAAFEAEHRTFRDGIAATSAAFRALPQDERPCLVWFGTGANEELTLRRGAYALSNSAREIWAAEVLPVDQKPLPKHWCTAVGVCREDDLRAIYTRRRLFSADERRTLADEWAKAVAESSDDTLRHYAEGRIETRPIGSYDDRLIATIGDTEHRTVRIVGDVMGNTEDAYVSDAFLFWRLRELARVGILVLDPFEAPMRESRVRRAG